MTNPLTAESTVYSGRAAAERLMTDACTVQRQTGQSMSEVTLVVTPTYSTIYTGNCRVKIDSAGDLGVDIGARAGSVRDYIVSVPVSATVFAVDDLVTITASPLDPSQVGLTLRILGALHGSQITARRFRCQEVTS
jgi:hypothetical protein